MADNFNLRQFLTENKLTKNAKLLAEAVTLDGKSVDVGSIEIEDIDTADYPDFSDAYITYAEFEDGTPLSEDELMRLEDENYGLTNELIHDRQMYMEEGVEDLEEWSPYGSIAFYGKDKPKEREPKEGEVELSTLNKGDVFKLADGKGIEFRVWGDDPKGGVAVQYTDYDEPRPNYTMRGTTKVIKLDGEISEAKSYKVSKNSKEAQHLKKGDIIGSGDEVVSVSAGAKTPSGKVEVTLKTKDGKTKTSTWGKTTKIGVKEKETVKESVMTQREKYLTRLVENALGLEGYGDDNVNRQREKQGLPPAQGPKYSEGISEEEMVQEKPIPSYKSIEELMKNIEHGTNETAAKYKMEEMKRIAQALEEKVTSLEEGEHAEHIDPKQVKQMKKDVMTLRKQAEKLEKDYDKKFGEKKAKKETKTELREGFDLRNFLVENKLTANSRMLKEEVGGLDEAAGEDLELKSAAKQIFSILKKHGLKPNYISGDVKLDKVNDSVVAITKDANTGTGLIKVNIWAWAVSKNKVDMKKLNSDILQVLGNEFENKSGQTSSNNESVYTMIIRKKVGQADPEPAAQ